MTQVTPLSAQPPGHKRNSHPHLLAVSFMLGLALITCWGCFLPDNPTPIPAFPISRQEEKVLKPHTQALRGYDYLGLSRITFPLYQALWQTRHNQTVAMATRTSFGASQSPEWQNGVLLLVAATRLDFLRGHPEQQDNAQPPHCSLTCLLAWGEPGLPLFCSMFISFCHYLKEKDSRLSPKQFFPSG